MSSLKESKGRITGDSPGNYCIISFPATFGQTAWNAFLASKFDLACVWTGKEEDEKDKWFDPWKKNVLEARDKGMKLLVIGHKNCTKGGGRQCTHVQPSIDGRPLWCSFRVGDGQGEEIKWLQEQNIPYYVYLVNSAVSPTVPRPPHPYLPHSHPQ